MAPHALSIQGLTVTVRTREGPRRVVDAADLVIHPGEIHALVGESGSGKTMLARSIIGLQPPGATITAKRLDVAGADVRSLTADARRQLRGAAVGMIFQEPLVSLNPAMRVGDQLAEAIRVHRRRDLEPVDDRIIAMLQRLKLPDPAGCLRRYPHEFSGGMRQRIMIASAMLLRPALLIADEPTTALDARVQREVLDLMVEVAREAGSAVLLVTHDLGLVAQYAQRVTVLEAGHVREQGDVDRVFASPAHSYTRELLASVPVAGIADRRGPSSADVERSAALLDARDLTVEYGGRRRLFGAPEPGLRALRGVDIHVRSGETVAIVGESGSGKSTLIRTLVGLVEPSAGTMLYDGGALGSGDAASLARLRSSMGFIHQDPYSSLDPRMRVGDSIAEGLERTGAAPAGLPVHERVSEALADVGLDPSFAARYPHQLSGGQRQRACIARALVARPRLVIGDEPLSALDVTTQARVIELLSSLQRRYGFALLMVTHDIAVVEALADRIVVMYRGLAVEEGATAQVLQQPAHSYTRELLLARPRLARSNGGYHLASRDFDALPTLAVDLFQPDEHARDARPFMRELAPGHRVACRTTGGAS